MNFQIVLKKLQMQKCDILHINENEVKKEVLNLTGVQHSLKVGKDPLHLPHLPSEEAVDVAGPRNVGRGIDFKKKKF
jgi:hypothetical protein